MFLFALESASSTAGPHTPPPSAPCLPSCWPQQLSQRTPTLFSFVPVFSAGLPPQVSTPRTLTSLCSPEAPALPQGQAGNGSPCRRLSHGPHELAQSGCDHRSALSISAILTVPSRLFLPSSACLVGDGPVFSTSYEFCHFSQLLAYSAVVTHSVRFACISKPRLISWLCPAPVGLRPSPGTECARWSVGPHCAPCFYTHRPLGVSFLSDPCR